MSLAALDSDLILGGTTTAPGSGGRRIAEQAELYLFDLTSRQIIWHEPLLAGVNEITDLHVRPDGLVYGLADRRRFFVFDPAARRIICEIDTRDDFGITGYQQGARWILADDTGRTFILFHQAIAEVDPDTFVLRKLAEPPEPISSGGDILDGRIYYASSAFIYSYELSASTE